MATRPSALANQERAEPLGPLRGPLRLRQGRFDYWKTDCLGASAADPPCRVLGAASGCNEPKSSAGARALRGAFVICRESTADRLAIIAGGRCSSSLLRAPMASLRTDTTGGIRFQRSDEGFQLGPPEPTPAQRPHRGGSIAVEEAPRPNAPPVQFRPDARCGWPAPAPRLLQHGARHRRATSGATPVRRRGSRRGATTRTASRGGDSGEGSGDDDPPSDVATPARRKTAGVAS
jgi:hypothetical protein